MQGQTHVLLWLSESESGNDTFRSLLSEYGRNYPWYQFGIDLVLGSPLDRPLTFRERLFAPELLREAMADARRADGEPVVVEESILVDGDDGVAGDDGGVFFTPMVVFGALLVFTIFISYRDVRRKRVKGLLKNGYAVDFFKQFIESEIRAFAFARAYEYSRSHCIIS